MAVSFRKLGIIVLAVLIIMELGGCSGGKTGKAKAEAGGQEPKDSRNFLLMLQQGLKSGDRSRIISMTRFPVQVGEVASTADPGTFNRAYDKALLDEASFVREYDRIWNQQTVKAVMDENPDQVEWTPGALSQNLGCGEVWFSKTNDGQFRITGFDISEYRNAGISLQDCYRVHDFVRQLQTAIASNNRTQVAGVLKYPLSFHAQHKTLKLHNAQETLRNYDLVFSDRLRRTIAEQQISNLLSNTNGVAIGDGFVWINEPSKNGPLKVVSIFEPPSHY